MALDERLRRELEDAARPADPSGVYEDLIRRRERRHVARRVGRGALGVVVVLGSIGGFSVLTRVFRERGEPPPAAAPAVSNGSIVFSVPLESGGEHVFAVGPDGTGLRQLTHGRDVHRYPDVSPDGHTVVVALQMADRERRSVLATIPIAGGSPSRLTEQPWHILDPAWSPDGGRIAFAGSPRNGPFGIYVFDVGTSDVRLVPGTERLTIGDPTWSPSGEAIAFEGSVAVTSDPPQTWDIYAARVDGADLTNLTRTPEASETWPAWSWATGRIAFVRGGAAAGVYTMTADGRDEALVTDALPNPTSPAWSPDGTMLAVAADTGQVFTIGADGRGVRPVSGALGEPAWQAVPDPSRTTVAPSPPTGPDAAAGEDIGVGGPVCDVASVAATFAPGIEGRAFVATRAVDRGPCPEPGDATQVLAVDVSGDGVADASYGPLECDPLCSLFAAPDVDGDGTDEVLVQNIQFSIAGLNLYDVRAPNGADAGAPAIRRVTVATPGYPGEGLEPGAVPQLWIGGDGFNVDTLRCVTTSSRRVLVQTSATMVPPDAPDAVWRAAQTTFALNADGTVSVVAVRNLEEPVDGSTSFEQGDGVCGARIPSASGR